MLNPKDCIPGLPVQSMYGDTGIVVSTSFEYTCIDYFRQTEHQVDTCSIIMSDGHMIKHANLGAFNVYRGDK
jgi:hypothetical protein